jgi:predicted nucleic acid-binding protein
MMRVDRFKAVLDACVLFPMLVRDILLTLADHGFFSPVWSPRIHVEWRRHLAARMKANVPAGSAQYPVDKIRTIMDQALPDALVTTVLPEMAELACVDPKDRHVVMTAIAAKADAIAAFNLSDFAAADIHAALKIEVVHPDDFIVDLIDLNEKRGVAAFKELLERKQRPAWSVDELTNRLLRGGLVQTSAWLGGEDVRALL